MLYQCSLVSSEDRNLTTSSYRDIPIPIFPLVRFLCEPAVEHRPLHNCIKVWLPRMWPWGSGDENGFGLARPIAQLRAACLWTDSTTMKTRNHMANRRHIARVTQRLYTLYYYWHSRLRWAAGIITPPQFSPWFSTYFSAYFIGHFRTPRFLRSICR